MNMRYLAVLHLHGGQSVRQDLCGLCEKMVPFHINIPQKP